MKFLKWIILLVSVLILLIGCQSATSSDAAPDFTLADSNGSTVHLADELQNNESVVLLFYLEHT